ncbi:MAG: DUF362 domain-containing protein [Phycisphaerae bacterium]
MGPTPRHTSQPGHAGSDNHRRNVSRHWLARWFWTNSIISGGFALLWLLLRSGSKPSRFAYPCQQAAFGTATAAFGVPLVAMLLATRRGIVTALGTRPGRILAACGLVGTLVFGAWAYSPRPSAYRPGPHRQARGTYRAQVYHVTNCPQNPVGDHFVGLDNLIAWMGVNGLKFYQSPTTTFEAGPSGIIGASDVVVIKINYQWDERGGTNVDVLRGLIRRIVDHPDGFTGEVVVCENAQFNSVLNFDRSANNAQNHLLSPHDVVAAFQAQGYKVSHYDWTVRRNTSVGEYSSGNMTDGYILYPYNSQLNGRVSYPKFRTAYGAYVSLKYGLWNPATSTYDRAGLKFVNVPVLKSHHATYGATACVKHYMGTVTGNLGTNSHNAIGYGILGELLAEIQLADLNILDCVWINANPYDGPWTTYGGATRRDELIASVDPVAADIWSVANILLPAFYANGYAPPWPQPSADPYDPTSDFRVYLDNSMDRILAAGYTVTNDLHSIDAPTWNGDAGPAGDIDGNGLVNGGDIRSFIDILTGVDTDPLRMLRSDLDGDRNLDLDDVTTFVTILLAS